jgi:hypothetical protein
LLKKVIEIESAIVKLTSVVSPRSKGFNSIKTQLETNEPKIIQLKTKSTNCISYSGWAASILITAGLFWILNPKTELKQQLQSADTENLYFEIEIEDARTDLAATKTLLNAIRDEDF